jgi:ElaB/YqjD/DUF883 family membrane-anchored ribosome-binding protein
MAERTDLTSASWQRRAQEAISGAERSAEEIREDIAARRESITDTVDRLSDRFQQTLDWKAYVSDHPLAALGVAAGLGFLAARIFKPRRSSGDRIKDALAYGLEDLAGRFHHQLESVAPHRSGLGGAVKAAVAGLVTKAATDYLQNRLVDRFAGADERYSDEQRHFHEPEYGPEYEKPEFGKTEYEKTKRKKRGFEGDSELFR